MNGVNTRYENRCSRLFLQASCLEREKKYKGPRIKGELFRIWGIWVSLKDEEKGKEKEVGGERKNKGVKSQVDGGEWDQEMVGS